MATKKVAIMVGLMGGSLYMVAPPGVPRRRLWVAIDALIELGLGAMRLNGAGTDAGAPDGRVLQAGGPDDPYTGAYYVDAAQDLRTNAPDSSWDVIALPFDWRKSCLAEGAGLAAAIVNDVEANGVESYTLVSHSQGGIIARVIWRRLQQLDKTAYVRRIVTVGTPHFGAYATLLSLLGVSEQLKEVAAYLNWVPWIRGGTDQPGRRFIANVSATWPAFYDLLPSLDSPLPTPGPPVSAVYVAKNYPNWSNVDQVHLDNGGALQAAIREPAAVPPPEIMVCVAGTGWNVFHGVDVQATGAGDQIVGNQTDGDGTVAFEDSFLPGYDTFTLRGIKHAEMMKAGGKAGLLSALAYEWRRGIGFVEYDSHITLPPSTVTASQDWMLPFSKLDLGLQKFSGAQQAVSVDP